MSRVVRSNARYVFVGMDGRETAVQFHYSAGSDGALVLFVDTNYEPNGSDGSRGLRIRINDVDVLETCADDFVQYEHGADTEPRRGWPA